jgi:hypothetical protein
MLESEVRRTIIYILYRKSGALNMKVAHHVEPINVIIKLKPDNFDNFDN